MSLHLLPISVILSNFETIVQHERRISRELLEYIAVIEKLRLYADEGFSSTHEWLVGRHGYSHASASRRVSAARMLCAVPEAAGKIETGELCMTTLSRVQSAIRFEEKRSGETMTPERKNEVISEIESKPKAQIDRVLAEMFPVVAPQREIVQAKCGGETRTHLTFTAEQMKKVERAAELLSHKLEGDSGSLACVIEAMADLVIAQKDPLVKSVKPRSRRNAEQSRCGVKPAQLEPVLPSTRNLVYRRDEGCCQFETSDGVKCLSRKFTQIDHVIPRALGGTNEPENLRVLCRTHNLMMAERVFGKETITAYRTRSSD